MEASSAPQTFLSSLVHALEADTKWTLDLPPQPPFPKPGTMIVARKLLEDVVDAHRNPESIPGQSPVIDVKTAYALYETITQAASLLAEIINASSLPANRLPAEILSKIFSLVPRAYKHPSITSHFPGCSSAFTRADDLQPIMEVCRYWREVALATSSLWSTVAETPPTDSKVWCRAPFWRYYLHRCTDGPLYVHINTRGSEETIALASRHRDRVRKLSITLDSGEEFGDDSHLMALSAPFANVEHYQIIVGLGSRRPTVSDRLASIVTCRTLPQSCRSLRCLVLANATFIPSNSFPSLTSLKYSFREPGPHWTLSLAHAEAIWINLLEFLSRCRALVTVGLYGLGTLGDMVPIFMTETVEWASLPHRIELPQLKELDLRDRGQRRDERADPYRPMYRSPAKDWLRNYRTNVPRAIHIPPTCRINIGIVHHPLDVEELYATLLNLGSGTGTSIARVAFQLDSEVETGLKLLSVDSANLDSPGPERTHVDLKTVYSIPPWEDLKYRPTFSSLPFFARLRELWIDADAHAAFMRVDLRSCALNLAEFAQLETLVVRRASAPLRESERDSTPDGPRLDGGGWEDRPSLATARDLLKSLERRAVADPTGNDAGASDYPCPFLATLRVDVIGSEAGVEDPDEAGYARGLAAARGAAGYPISRLLIGVILRDDVLPKPYVVSQYDAEGWLTVTGNHEADRLAYHWRKSFPHY